MRKAVWYFDVISPYAYLHLTRFAELPADLEIAYRKQPDGGQPSRTV